MPTLIGALFWKNSTREGAIASTITGFLASVFGFLFLHQKEAAALGVSETIFGKSTLLGFPWTHVDPLFYALPLSTIVFVAVSLGTGKKQKTEAKPNLTDETSKEQSIS